MLTTVHTYLNSVRAETGITLGKIEAYICDKHPDLSMSDTKLSKIFKVPGTKISIEELFAIVESMGRDKKEILAILGEQEYRASEAMDYKRAELLVAEHEKEKESLLSRFTWELDRAKEIRESMQISFDNALSKLDSTYSQMLREKDERIESSAVLNGTLSKSVKQWRIISVCSLFLLCFVLIYILWEISNLDKGATSVLIQMIKDNLI